MKFAVNGVAGRMGRSVYRIMTEQGHSLFRGFDVEANPFFGKDAALLVGATGGTPVCALDAANLRGADAVIDFTAPAVTMQLLGVAVEARVPVVVGTTGIDAAGRDAIREAARHIPVLFTANMSLGVNLAFKILKYAASIMPERYDVEIFEAHHNRKKDAPSGTALRMFDIVKENSPCRSDAVPLSRPEGIIGERTKREIGMQVLRGGDIVGEHTVFFVGEGERIEITHRCTNRENFAQGAVAGAAYIAGKPAGLYTIEDVLGI